LSPLENAAIDRPYAASGLTLPAAARLFSRCPTARILAPVVIAVAAIRVGLGRWHWSDLIIPAAILGLEPFTEWLIHVGILHWKPRRVGRATIDPLVSRRHRQHHRAPQVVGLVLVPAPALLGLIIGSPIFYGLIFRSVRPATTAVVTSLSMLYAYEWTHFLIHSSYRPRRALYRGIWRAHRLHHFRNERYWFGVTMHMGDRVLRTYPAKDAVPLSSTARTLGVDLAA
jgi:sterol desaturase/sphingolipid hydroxylase (fatty acid hydroxylase superfamily)